MSRSMRNDRPSGTVTFLFTDVEGSTRLLRELGAEQYADAGLSSTSLFAISAANGSRIFRPRSAFLRVPVHSTEEAKKLAVLSPLARAEVDAALSASDDTRAEHLERARAAVARGREILAEFPPPTAGSIQMETPATYLAMAEAEVSRISHPGSSALAGRERARGLHVLPSLCALAPHGGALRERTRAGRRLRAEAGSRRRCANRGRPHPPRGRGARLAQWRRSHDGARLSRANGLAHVCCDTCHRALLR